MEEERVATLEQTVMSLLAYPYTRQQLAALPILLEYVDQEFRGVAGSIAPYVVMDVYRGVMHLYQLYPSSMDAKVVRMILLKSMLLLPSSDFLGMLLCVPASTQLHVLVAPVLELAKLLQDGHILKFWDKLYAVEQSADAEQTQPALVFGDFIASPGTLQAIRRFIVGLLCISYSQMNADCFCKMLHIQNDSDELKTILKTTDASIVTAATDYPKTTELVKFNFPHDNNFKSGPADNNTPPQPSFEQQHNKYFNKDALKHYAHLFTSKSS